MIDVNEAYKKVKRNNPGTRANGCLDFGTFFVFSMIPLYMIGNESYYTGTVMSAVDKKTGDVFEYDLTTDVEAYFNAKKINVPTVFDEMLLS